MADNINIYVKETKLNDVAGRVDYISNPERQEEKLIAVVGQHDPSFWNQLAADCRFATKNGECVEARELIVQLPNNISELSEEEMLQKLQSLKQLIDSRTGTDCMIALHDSHKGAEGKPGNKHVHIIAPERELLPNPEQIIAERNLFFDETGKRKYKKSDIFQDGELRPGCKVIPKGTMLHERHFGSKNDDLSSQDWLNEIKKDTAAWINQELQPDRKRVVFDQESSPLIPCFHVGKGLPEDKKQSIINDNQVICTYNSMVRRGEIPLEDAYRYKTLIMLSPKRATEIRAIFKQILQQRKPEYQYQDTTASVPRTRNTDPEKEELRAMYKRSAEVWKAYREEDDQERKQMLLRRGRAISAEIDQKKKEMGLWQLHDYEKAIEKSMKEAEWWRRQMIYAHNRLVSFSNRNSYLQSREEYLQHLIDEEKQKWFPDRTYIASLKEEKKEIREQIRENDREWSAAYHELKEKQREARREYKAAKKQIKVQKKELRAAKKQEKQLKKTTEVKDLNSKLNLATGRSGAPGTTKPQRKDREVR